MGKYLTCVSAIALVSAPGFAAEKWDCELQTICFGQDPCGPPDQQIALSLEVDGDLARFDFDGDGAELRPVSDASNDPRSFVGQEGGRGAVLVSLYQNRDLLFTVHSDFLGTFMMSGYATCLEAE